MAGKEGGGGVVRRVDGVAQRLAGKSGNLPRGPLCRDLACHDVTYSDQGSS
jgi:hypothetical protein